MPEIVLNIPNNSRFSSSLNEIDLAMREIFLTEMRLADPRDQTHRQMSLGSDNNWLWDRERIFQVDDMTTEEVFDTWLLRHSHVNKNVDVTYPLLAYKQNEIKDVFWGTGNRYKQWEIMVPPANAEIEIGDLVVIKDRSNKRLFGTKANVCNIVDNGYTLYYEGTDRKITDLKNKPIIFSEEVLGQFGDKAPIVYKAKAITGTYSAVILVDNRDEAQYIRDHFILRCNDANIWFTYASPTIEHTANHIYTVFEIPTLERYPTPENRLKGQGYVYGVGIDVNIWAALTDTAVPSEIIEMIRMNLQVHGEPKSQKIIITK